MKSSLKIDFKGPTTKEVDGFEPVIRVVIEPSDDARDKLVKAFFELLGGKSSWLKIEYENSLFKEREEIQCITISPVKPKDLEKEYSNMKEILKNC